jgi:hypothetical protein
MPNPKQHQAKADHNRAFLAMIKDPSYADWLATAAFYTSVHLVEKLRAYDGDHSQSHMDRNEFVRKQHPSIHASYHQLFNISIIARYQTMNKFPLTAAAVQTDLVDGDLAAIEVYVANVTAAKTALPSDNP